MEAKCAKMPPTGSKLTEALKTWQNSLSKFAYYIKSGEKKNSVMNSIFRNSTHKYYIWYRISHFRGGASQDLDDLVEDDPTQTFEVKKSSCSIFSLILRIALQELLHQQLPNWRFERSFHCKNSGFSIRSVYFWFGSFTKRHLVD